MLLTSIGQNNFYREWPRSLFLSENTDKERDKKGNLIQADVSLCVQTLQTVPSRPWKTPAKASMGDNNPKKELINMGGQKPVHNYPYLKSVWDKVQAENPGYRLTQFSRDNGVPYDRLRHAFKRLEKRSKTERLFSGLENEDIEKVIGSISNERISEIHASVLSALYASLERIAELQKSELKIIPSSAQDLKMAVSAVAELVRALREILPFLLELEDRSRLINIVNQLQTKEINVTQAALEISKMGARLPEALRIMLSKTTPIMISQNFETPDMDALDKRALETLKQVRWQYECFLPERREEVIEIKKEFAGAESFTPESEKP